MGGYVVPFPRDHSARLNPMPPAAKAKATKAPKVKEPKKEKVEVKARTIPPLTEIRQAADLLKQVSDPTRLQVLLLLASKELNVTEICLDLPKQSQPSVSHHLALLRHGRLIEPRRAGKHNYYSLTDQGRKLSEVLLNIVV